MSSQVHDLLEFYILTVIPTALLFYTVLAVFFDTEDEGED